MDQDIFLGCYFETVTNRQYFILDICTLLIYYTKGTFLETILLLLFFLKILKVSRVTRYFFWFYGALLSVAFAFALSLLLEQWYSLALVARHNIAITMCMCLFSHPFVVHYSSLKMTTQLLLLALLDWFVRFSLVLMICRWHCTLCAVLYYTVLWLSLSWNNWAIYWSNILHYISQYFCESIHKVETGNKVHTRTFHFQWSNRIQCLLKVIHGKDV